jgi:hypothetical protein
MVVFVSYLPPLLKYSIFYDVIVIEDRDVCDKPGSKEISLLANFHTDPLDNSL